MVEHPQRAAGFFRQSSEFESLCAKKNIFFGYCDTLTDTAHESGEDLNLAVQALGENAYNQLTMTSR